MRIKFYRLTLNLIGEVLTFPNLSLLQIGFSNEIYIIDCLACNPANLVKEFLESISHLKIFHSSRSDATILSKCLGVKTFNCFDIQQGEKK